nr:hypothetical protein [Klebsiella pneumoniae]
MKAAKPVTPGRSWALVHFCKNQRRISTVIATSKTYDVFGSANNGATMSADIEALASGTYVCVLTFDEPSGNRGKILSALESLVVHLKSSTPCRIVVPTFSLAAKA